jgi:peptide-methionine (R)-S-oxide reductase
MKLVQKLSVLMLMMFVFANCQETKKTADFEVQKPKEEWKKELTPEQFEVLREKGTERAFTGEYWDHFENGYYACAACDTQLFASDAKYNSDCGWPSFDKAIKGSVVFRDDFSFGMNRQEVVCAKCGGHLGHIFDDGPKETTGKRFCMNSVSLKFVPAKEE